MKRIHRNFGIDLLVGAVLVASPRATLAHAPGPRTTATGEESVPRQLARSPRPEASHTCISLEERARIAQGLADYEAAHGPMSSAPSDLIGGAPPHLYEFWPQAGNLSGDLLPSGLVDLDPSPGVLSFDCTSWSYDGHTGQDSEIRGFAAQAVGVPVFAALDGTVVYTHDSEFDMNTECQGDGNGVIIDHGLGRRCIYWHFKQGSAAVSVGQFVRAGEQLGLTGSSGCSTGPHLHFETMDDYQIAQSFESFAGPCRPGPSGWVDQPILTSDTYVWNFSVTATDPSTVPSIYPFEKPRHAQIAFTDPRVYTDMVGIRSRAAGEYRYRFSRPDGTLAYDTGLLDYPNDQSFWIVSGNGLLAELWVHHQGFDVPDMHSIAGTWTVRMEMDGVQVLEAPIEVVPVRDPDFNRPPQPINASFDPTAPQTDDTLFCRLSNTGPIYLTDLDWDLVRYHYVWTVDGNVVRDVTTAGMADALPRLSIPNGSFVECTVTPSDGHPGGVGAPVAISVFVTGDCNGNGIPDVVDIADGTSLDCGGEGVPDECEPDCNGNGVADSCDIAAGTVEDCSGNGIPDSCEPDCDNSGVADTCEIAAGISTDCDGDGVPDSCEEDCNGNSVPDDCEAVPVLAGSSLDFDGVDDTIALESHGLNFAGQITFEAWIRQEATDGVRIILGHGSPFTRKGTALFTQDARYGVVGVSSGAQFVYGAMPATDLGRWVHLAGVYDGAYWRLYRNGQLLAESPGSFGARVGSAEWAIGSGGGGATNFFQGGIDEVRIWQVARTQAEIQAAMNTTLTGNEPGLRGYWRLDEGGGTTAEDSAPHGGRTNGTLQNGPAWVTNQPCLPGGGR